MLILKLKLKLKKNNIFFKKINKYYIKIILKIYNRIKHTTKLLKLLKLKLLVISYFKIVVNTIKVYKWY